jgi:hypothetical protein
VNQRPSHFRFTLLTDGSSDRALIPILNWLLVRNGIHGTLVDQWADFQYRRRPLKRLSERIAASIQDYPCELLFIHRDAEGISYEDRKAEILSALEEVKVDHLPAVCVVPVRMQEAWLLFSEAAIRQAARNPKGRVHLEIPGLSELEHLPDLKTVLHELLRKASELPPHRRFEPRISAHYVAEFARDFTPLLRLRAFQALDEDVKRIFQTNRWST